MKVRQPARVLYVMNPLNGETNTRSGHPKAYTVFGYELTNS